MSDSVHTAAHAFEAEYLPIWWRCVLVAMATIIFCSCSSPAVRTALSADKSLNDSAHASSTDGAEVVIQDCPVELPADESLRCEQYPYGAGGAIPLDPYGPLPGPSDEYLCDGGDFGTPAGVTTDRKIAGLEPEDAISHYDTADGRVLVTPSNRVCIYAPRFAAVRRVVEVASHQQPVFVNATMEEQSPAKA